MLREDLNGKLLQRAELVAQREELDQIIESYKESEAIEVDFYNLEVKTKKTLEDIAKRLNELTIEKKKHIIQLKEITDHISHYNDEFFLISKNPKIALNTKDDKSKENTVEIEKIEALLNRKIQELQLPSFEEMLTEFFGDYDNIAEKEILTNQLKLIEKEEVKMESNFQSKKENIYQAIDTLKKQRSDPDTKNALKELTNRLDQLETGYSLQKDTLSSWKDSVIEAVNESNTESTQDTTQERKVDQKKLMQNIEVYLQERNIGEKSKREFYEILNKYFEVVYYNEISSKIRWKNFVIKNFSVSKRSGRKSN